MLGVKRERCATVVACQAAQLVAKRRAYLQQPNAARRTGASTNQSKSIGAACKGFDHVSFTPDIPNDHAMRASTRWMTLPDIAFPTAWFIFDWSRFGVSAKRLGRRPCKRII